MMRLYMDTHDKAPNIWRLMMIKKKWLYDDSDDSVRAACATKSTRKSGMEMTATRTVWLAALTELFVWFLFCAFGAVFESVIYRIMLYQLKNILFEALTVSKAPTFISVKLIHQGDWKQVYLQLSREIQKYSRSID